MSDRYFDAVILSRRSLTERIAEFSIGMADGTRLPMAEAGSHVELRFGGDDGIFLRHYSIVGPLGLDDVAEPFWRIAVQRENRSRGSAFIHQRFKPGTRLKVSRPRNAFRLPRHAPHVLLVAGGIGITPILAMARSLRWRNAGFSMLYAGLDRAGMAYVDELETLCGGHLRVHEARHHGVPDLIALLSGQPPDTVACICGPSMMIEALREAGSSLGWDQERIRFEVFNAAHKADDAAFEVRTSSGRTLRIAPGTTILDALEAAGIDTLSDCRRGECGLCTTDVISCDGDIDHRDRFFSEDEHRAGKQITLCCSRITGRRLEIDI